ncbi:MAG: hypothetical protein JNJ83_02255 [Verrucomicrobiaceae bacterium]|nr:hypothetical protein [Verrucomicrobiaceae bacterium]
MTVLVCDDGCQDFLAQEIKRRWLQPAPQLRTERAVIVESDALPSSSLMFVRQALPAATKLSLPSISAWAKSISDPTIELFRDETPWRLHLAALYGEGKAGQNRLRLIQDAVIEQLKKRRRARLKSLTISDTPFTEPEGLVQLVLTAPDEGFLSIMPPPAPAAHRHLVSPFLLGEIPVSEDKSAPSRAFAKLVEAQKRLGRAIQPGETVIDLGASPGGWTYVAVNQGARVTSIDRSPLRPDLMAHPRVTFIKGDAFAHEPTSQVDWIVCDVIAAPERSIDLLLNLAKKAKMKHFAFSIKFQGDQDYHQVDKLAEQLPQLCSTFLLTRLSANKNEACAVGSLKEG